MKKKFEISVPGGATKVLLHTCCAPCSSAIIECLMRHGITPTIYYSNPNIFPLEEYEIRKNECTRYAKSLGLDIIDDDYDHEKWRCEMAGLEDEPERGGRCLKCFKYRLLRTARYAHEHGFKVITTINSITIYRCYTLPNTIFTIIFHYLTSLRKDKGALAVAARSRAFRALFKGAPLPQLNYTL